MASIWTGPLARALSLWSLMLVFPAPLLVALNAQMTDAAGMRAYISLGLLAYCWWLLAILLSARPPWLDRWVGMPQIYALHGVLGVVALGAGFLHKQNTFSAGVLARSLGDWGFWISFGVLCYSVIFLSGWITDRSVVMNRAKRFLERALRHGLSVWIHRLNLVVVAMIFLHVHLIDRVSQHFWFMVLFDLYTVMVAAVWAWKKWGAPDGYLTGAVAYNTPLGEATRKVSIVLDAPTARARPGDFYFLRVEHPGVSREWHPFSATDARSDRITFTIRQTGDFTRDLDSVPAGARVRLEGPFGRFDETLRGYPSDVPIVLVGMGAGVAPLMSLIAGHLPRRRILLLWSVRAAEDAYYGPALDEYRREYGGNLHSVVQVGRFRKEQLASLVGRDELERAAFFVVGPNPAVLATQRTLRGLGVPRGDIHHERLTM